MANMSSREALDTIPLTDPDTIVRRRVGRFRETRKMQVIRAALGTLCKVAPNTAARLAYALLARPPVSQERPWQSELRASANLSWLRLGIRTIPKYSWGRGPTILMVHGWGARATHMGKLIEPLVKAGYRVVSFDAPAHGHSNGRRTDLVEYASTISAVARSEGPIHTILAHSFGVAMALYARRDWGVEAQRQVFISSFNHCKWFTEAFRHYVGISSDVMERARQIMVDLYQGRLDWETLSVVEMLRHTREPTLLIHDRQDEEIPFNHCISLYGATKNGSLFTTSGLGHHRLLGDSGVINRVLQFIAHDTRVIDIGENRNLEKNALQSSATKGSTRKVTSSNGVPG